MKQFQDIPGKYLKFSFYYLITPTVFRLSFSKNNHLVFGTYVKCQYLC